MNLCYKNNVCVCTANCLAAKVVSWLFYSPTKWGRKATQKPNMHVSLAFPTPHDLLSPQCLIRVAGFHVTCPRTRFIWEVGVVCSGLLNVLSCKLQSAKRRIKLAWQRPRRLSHFRKSGDNSDSRLHRNKFGITYYSKVRNK